MYLSGHWETKCMSFQVWFSSMSLYKCFFSHKTHNVVYIHTYVSRMEPAVDPLEVLSESDADEDVYLSFLSSQSSAPSPSSNTPSYSPPQAPPNSPMSPPHPLQLPESPGGWSSDDDESTVPNSPSFQV